ncbi:MAG: hypothetical protein JO257_22795 [Deltaproteobacteria bacterium]|nr:hypothetical protein [Deltaproteobacteria bacterium]
MQNRTLMVALALVVAVLVVGVGSDFARRSGHDQAVALAIVGAVAAAIGVGWRELTKKRPPRL